MSLLANRHRNQDLLLQCWKPPGVTPLEIWDLIVDDKNLWEWQAEPGYPEALLRALKGLRDGSIESESKDAINPVARGFDSVFVCGGRSQNEDIRTAIRQLGLPVQFGKNPVHGACLAAVEHFQSCSKNVLAIDVGQTQIKIVLGGKTSLFERDLSELPVRNRDEPTPTVEEQRPVLTNFISNSIVNFLTDHDLPPDTVILALPCFIHSDLRPGGSSYIGMKDHPSLLQDVILKTGLTEVPWRITNDAELAAIQVKDFPGLSTSGKTLVLTLGFGTGGCIVERQQK